MTASDRPAKRAILPRALGIALVMAGIGAAIMYLQLMRLEEASDTDRARLLVLIAGLGAFVAALIGAMISGWLSRRFSGRAVMLVSFVLGLPAFIAGFAGCFAVHNRYIVGAFESIMFRQQWWFELAYSPASAVGMFLQTGTKYFLPWPDLILASAFTGLVGLAFLRK
jgi:MFS family permease